MRSKTKLFFYLIISSFLFVLTFSHQFPVEKVYAGEGPVCGACQPVKCNAGCGQVVENLWSGHSCEPNNPSDCPTSQACCYDASWCCLVCQPTDCPGGTEPPPCSPTSPSGLVLRYPPNDEYLDRTTSSIDLQWSLSSWGSCCDCGSKKYRVRIGTLYPAASWWNIYNKSATYSTYGLNEKSYRYMTMLRTDDGSTPTVPYVNALDPNSKATYFWAVQATMGDATKWSSVHKFTYVPELLPKATVYNPQKSVGKGDTGATPYLVMPGREYIFSGSASDSDSNLASLTFSIKKDYDSSNAYNTISTKNCVGNTCDLQTPYTFTCKEWTKAGTTKAAKTARTHELRLEAWDYMPASNELGGRVRDSIFLEVSPTINLRFHLRSLKSNTSSCSLQSNLGGMLVTLRGQDPTNLPLGEIVLATGVTDPTGFVTLTNIPRQVGTGWSNAKFPYYKVEIDPLYQIGYTRQTGVSGDGHCIVPVENRTNQASIHLHSVPAACGQITFDIGVQVTPAAATEAWTTTVDGDAFVSDLFQKIPATTPLGDFVNAVANLNNTALVSSAFVFASGNIFDTARIVESNKGGYSKLTGQLDSYLNAFNFKAPTHASVVSINSLGAAMNANTVYKMSVATFNSLVPTTYGIAGNGTSILYVEGDPSSDTITIKSNIISTGGNLLLVTNVPITFTKDVGTTLPLANLNIINAPNLMMGFVTGENVSIESTGDPVTEMPVTFGGPLIMRKDFSSSRDLDVNNPSYPTQVVNYNPAFLYPLTHLERSHPEEKSFTGLGVYDVQWFYEN